MTMGLSTVKVSLSLQFVLKINEDKAKILKAIPEKEIPRIEAQ